MRFARLENVLWAAGFVGHAALLVVLFVKARWRELPAFTLLIGYEVLTTAVLFGLARYGSRHAYVVGYWTYVFVEYGLQLALIVEMSRAVLRPTGTWVRDARTEFLVGGLVGVLIAAAFAWKVGPPQARGLSLWEVRAMLFTSLLTCELFVAMAMAANRLGLRWRSHVMALGQGLAAWSGMAVISDVAHVALGWGRQFVVLDQLRMLVYMGALVWWIVAFWFPERERGALSVEMQEYLVALHRRVHYDLESVRTADKSS